MANITQDDPTQLEWWAGRLAGVARGIPTADLRNPIKSSGGGTGAFLGLASNGKQYWVKVADNPQGTQVIVNEVVVAGIGQLLGAPIRPTELVKIPSTLTEWRVVPGMALHHGVAHASEHLEYAEENDSFEYRGRDNNRVRQASLIALWDLCMGGDPQWLYDLANEYSVWSFDHGLWLGGDGYWTRESIYRVRDVPWEWSETLAGLDRSAFDDFANKLMAISSGQLLRVVASVPIEWSVPDEDLEALAWFIYYRRNATATRLRALAAQA